MEGWLLLVTVWLKSWNGLKQIQPEFRKCWDVFKIWIKWNLREFQITWANILFTIEHREHKCLNWEILQFYAQNELISNLMPATGLKIVGMGACLPWCSISSYFQNSFKTSGNRGWVSGVLVLGFGPILAWYRFPAAEEFVVVFDVFFV